MAELNTAPTYIQAEVLNHSPISSNKSIKEKMTYILGCRVTSAQSEESWSDRPLERRVEFVDEEWTLRRPPL